VSSTILLKGSVRIITNIKNDAWRVVSGGVYVYVAPWENDTAGRPVFLYEAKAGEVLPSLCFKDYQHVEWRFSFSAAADTAGVSVIRGGNTSVLRRRFSERVGLDSTEREGFDGAVVNFYKLSIVTEDGLIHKTTKKSKQTHDDILSLILNVFTKRHMSKDNAPFGASHPGGIREHPVFFGDNFSHDKPNGSKKKFIEACRIASSIEEISRLSRLSYREVVLDENWHKSDSGLLLVYDYANKPIACLPRGQNRYTAYFAGSKKSAPVSDTLAHSVNPKAYALYRTLPDRPIGTKDLFYFCAESINTTDVFQIVLYTIMCAAAGLLLPLLNKLLFDTLIPAGSSAYIIQFGLVVCAALIGSTLISISGNIVGFRLTSRIGIDLQCAMLERVYNLPIRFFRKYESADIAQRLHGAAALAESASRAFFVTGITMITSIAYLVVMLSCSILLSLAGIAMLALYAVLTILLSYREHGTWTRIKELDGKADSTLYQFVNGISKLRMSGTENKALFEYLKIVVKNRELDGQRSIVFGISSALSFAASGLFSVTIYWLLVRFGVSISVGSFIAFMTAFSLFSGVFISACSEIVHIRKLKPDFERLIPILTENPENADTAGLPDELSGEFNLQNVTFSYSQDMPNVIDDISLHISAGEYVGVIGPSGCGKSTLLKLLLGFEKPDCGAICYDGNNIETLNKRGLRKKIGAVLQDGSLISGSIMDNITITAPNSSLDEVKKVVRIVGLEEDIKAMPMGLHTILSEDCRTISGGQQQRILIARAIIGKPNLLFFDEATSALDNISQALVCGNLDKMKTTRLVIAHRLSTVLNCDRILVMDDGKIVEQGTYQELMNIRGLFYELAKRQT
jgi:ATP-binding cassette subfamily C protein